MERKGHGNYLFATELFKGNEETERLFCRNKQDAIEWTCRKTLGIWQVKECQEKKEKKLMTSSPPPCVCVVSDLYPLYDTLLFEIKQNENSKV